MDKYRSKTKRKACKKSLPKIILSFFAMMLFCSGTMLAQSHNVKGRVVDESTKEPLVGVTVSVKESPTIGTMTDIDGNYSINVPNKNATLKISYIGYVNQEIKVDGRSSIDVLLKDNAKELDEVQVVAYGAQKKVTITGAISSVSGDDLLKAPTGSLTNALAGKVTGLTSVQYSGEPGADEAQLLIRGVTTLNNSSPLVQVDGVERDFAYLDPNEIESITILKDASATAVFGVRGANGVILVTTKRGAEGKAKIAVTTSMGVQVPTRLLEFANSYQWATYYNEAQRNDGTTSGFKFDDEALQAFKDHSQPILYPDIDWMDYLLKKSAFQSQHNINISGGAENVRYFVSVGAFTQSGLFKTFDAGYDFNFDYKRYNYRANLDFDISKATMLSVNLGGRIDDKNTPISAEDQNQLFRHLYWATPFSGAGIVDGKWIKTNSDYISSPGADGLNPYYGKGFNSKVTNTLNLDLILQQKLDVITNGLSFKLKGSYNSDYYHNKQRSSSIAYYTPVKNASGGFDLRKSGDDGQLGYSESFDKGRNWYMEASFNYNRKFGDHNVGGLVLYNQSKKYYPKTYTEIPSGYVGLVGRATYDFKSRYMAEFNVGYNGSENFAEGRRYGFFPAGSVGWIVTEEPFAKGIKDYINYFKLRASYGVVGNDKYGDNRFLYIPVSYVLGGGYNFGTNTGNNQPGAYEGKLTNPYLTWEKAYKQNYGLDMYVLNERLNFSFDLFKEHREDILVSSATIPGIIGVGTDNLPLINSGVVDSHGYEINLKWEDNVGSDIRYWANGNLSYSKNKIIEKNEITPNEDYLWQTGHPVNQPFVRKFWGFFDETANERYKLEYGHDIAEHAGGLQPGDCVYVDLNNDGIINADDVTALGYTNNPEYIAGLNLGFAWKGFDLAMQWTGAWNTSRLLQESFRDPLGETKDRSLLLSQYENRWTRETAATATLPRASFASRTNNTANSDLFLVDAKYLRLKSIEIGYNFDFPFMKKAKLNSLRLYANGYNLLTFDKLKIADPESRTSDRPNYPLTKVFNIGLKVGF